MTNVIPMVQGSPRRKILSECRRLGHRLSADGNRKTSRALFILAEDMEAQLRMGLEPHVILPQNLRRLRLLAAGFDPDEPRIAKGEPGGGRWTREGEEAPDGPGAYLIPAADHGAWRPMGIFKDTVDADPNGPEVRRILQRAEQWQGTRYANKNDPNAGRKAKLGVGADCSGSFWRITQESGYPDAKYAPTSDFIDAVYRGDVPFRPLMHGEDYHLGDAILFPGHLGFYAGRENGQDMVWSATRHGFKATPFSWFGTTPQTFRLRVRPRA